MMKNIFLNVLCAAAFLASISVFAQDEPSLNDLVGALRHSQGSDSRDPKTEENTNSTSSNSNEEENADEPFEFTLNNPNGEYEKNELFNLSITVKTDGFLYIVNVASGSARCVFPNAGTSQNSIRAGETRQIPDRFSGFKWRFSGESPTEQILILFSKITLSEEDLASICQNCEKKLQKNTGFDKNVRKWIEFDEENAPEVWYACVLLKLKGNESESNTSENARRKRVAFFFAHTNYVDYATGKSRLDRLVAFTVGSCVRSMRAAKDFGKFDDVRLLSGPELSKKNVYDAFEKMKNSTNPGDEIFIYWIGHGIQYQYTEDERDHKHESLLLSTVLGETNANGEATGNVDPKPETTIQDDELADLLTRLSGRKVALLLQTCYSGGVLEDKSLNNRAFRNEPRFNVKTVNDEIAQMVALPYDYDEFLQYVPRVMDFGDLEKSDDDERRLVARLERLDGRRGSKDDFAKTFVQRVREEVCAKDVSRNAPDLAILATCLESECSNARVLVDGKNIAMTTCGEYRLPVCPLDFALLTVLTDKTGKYARNPGKADLDDLWNVAEKFIPANGERLSKIYGADCLQEPVFINNIGKVALVP